MKKQIIYTRINGEWQGNKDTLMNSFGEWECNLKEENGYFLTEEELKKLLSDYTDKIVENVDLTAESYQSMQEGSICQIDKESITSQLPKFLKEQGL